MNVNEVLKELKSSQISIKKTNASRIQASYVTLGVKMKDIRILAKKIGIDHKLALELFKTNIYEAMMLSTMIASIKHVTIDLLEEWAIKANSSSIINQGLSGLMMKVEHYDSLMMKWCTEDNQHLRYAGFTILSSYFRFEDLNVIDYLFSIRILTRIENTILSEPLTVQNAMNNAVVMAGLHVPSLVDKANEVAKEIGYILPLVAKNSCNIQSATDYLIRYKNNKKYSRVAKLQQE